MSDETLCWVFVALGCFCLLIVGMLLWFSQRTYRQMLSKIDLVPQAPVWTYTKKETSYYDPKYAPPTEKAKEQ